MMNNEDVLEFEIPSDEEILAHIHTDTGVTNNGSSMSQSSTICCGISKCQGTCDQFD
jgi:hypothetical protein